MKKILSLLGVIILIGTSTTSLVACNKSKEYTKEKLAKLKKVNNKIINGNKLEWISSQEKPFNNIDNRYYFVVWNGDENDDWRIVKFKYDKYEKNKVLDKYNNYELQLFETGTIWQGRWKDICLVTKIDMPRYFAWSFYPNNFKSVYRLDKVYDPDTPNIDLKTGEITDWKEVKENK